MMTVYRIKNITTGEMLPIPRLSKTEAVINAESHKNRMLIGGRDLFKYEIVQESCLYFDKMLFDIMERVGVCETTARALLADANL